jgi:cytochrome c
MRHMSFAERGRSAAPGTSVGGRLWAQARKPCRFRYSSGYAATDFVWDEEHLDTYLADPQALIPGAIMLYKQKSSSVRKAIISFLKEQK